MNYFIFLMTLSYLYIIYIKQRIIHGIVMTGDRRAQEKFYCSRFSDDIDSGKLNAQASNLWLIVSLFMKQQRVPVRHTKTSNNFVQKKWIMTRNKNKSATKGLKELKASNEFKWNDKCWAFFYEKKNSCCLNIRWNLPKAHCNIYVSLHCSFSRAKKEK